MGSRGASLYAALSDYLRNLPQAHRYLCWFAKVVVLFRRPFRFLLITCRRTSPGDRVVEMCRRHAHPPIGAPHECNYAVRHPGARGLRAFPPAHGVDIGGEPRAFALYAARRGARTVLAYEPNGAAFRCLPRNIEVNGLSAPYGRGSSQSPRLPGKT